MAARDVMDAAVLNRGIIEANPTRQVRHRLHARPVRIILMPRNYAAVSGRFAEQLVVPESQRAAEQLRRGHQERRVPKQVMKRRRNSPRAQRMKKHHRRIGRFVRMKFVEEVMTGMFWIDKFREFVAKGVNLLIVQDTNAGEITISTKKTDPIVSSAGVLST